MLDLDHFKRVNDTHGHAAGDVVLQTLATRLRSVLRREDLVTRFGGEEVVVFLHNTKTQAAMDAATRLCELVRGQPFVLPDATNLPVTASMGGAWSRTTGMSGRVRLEGLMTQADAMLYVAKEAGRDCWRFDVSGNITASPTDASRAGPLLAA